MEHSLVSLSKWESIHEKPFLTEHEKTSEEILSYIEIMILTPNVPKNILERFSKEDFIKINSYLQSKQTATWFSETKMTPKSREAITAELIYYWMLSLNIPIECENWHLNRLFTLMKICSLKNQKPQKMSRREMAERNRELNARRKAQLGTSG